MSTFLFRFFGPGQVVDTHKSLVPLRSRKQLALLAYLATEHAIAHSRESLVALLWPDVVPTTAQNNLRVTLSRLRKLATKLTPTELARPPLLITDRHTVQIDAAWIEAADINQFNQLLVRTRRHAHPSRSQCDHCQTLLRQAVLLYQGEFLEGFGLGDCDTFEEWLSVERERLQQLVLDAYADLATYAEHNNDLAAAHDAAQRQIELDPLRESAYQQQMRILTKLGKRNAALTLFEQYRTLLRNELGIDPQLETLTLHTEILNSEVAPSITTATWRTLPRNAPPRHNLPQQLTPFIGREEELAALQTRLKNRSYRLISIVGPGGIGKSRLAQEAAAQQLNEFRDGVYFVSLAQVPAAEAIPLAIVETLGLSFDAGDKSEAEQLYEMIAHKQLLLVLDNFEHLMDGVNLLVPLLQQAPEVLLLITSRQRLDLQTEDLFELQGLPVPESSIDTAATHFAAIRLFVDRAYRLDKQFQLTAAEFSHVVKICQLVEGFPLAIELAVTWMRDLTCEEIVMELIEGLDRLETAAPDIDPQHRSLRAVFDASWRLLSTQEQQTLAKLAVFSGGFTVDAARTVAGGTPALLSMLRNKSLLRYQGSHRYDMHTLVHQFSAEALAQDAATAAQIQHAHTQYFLTLLADQAVALDTRSTGAAVALIQPEWENIVIAWQQATAHMNLILLQNGMDGLHRFCNLRGLYVEIETLFEHTVSRLEALDTLSVEVTKQPLDRLRLKLHCRLLTGLIYVAECRGQFERTQELTQQALTLATRLDSKVEFIYIHIARAQAYEVVADYTQGLALAEQMLELAQAEGLEIQAGICMELIGYNAYRLGDYGRAHEIYQRLLAFHEQTGRLAYRTRLALSILGSLAIDQGEYELGLTYYQRFLASSEAADDRVNAAHAYDYLARTWNYLGDYEQAIQMATQSFVRSDMISHVGIKRLALLSKGYAQRQLGQLTEALSTFNEAVALARRGPSSVVLAESLAQLAKTQLALAKSSADWAEAAANLRQAADHLYENGAVIPAYEATISWADLAYRQQALPEALSLITPIISHLPLTNAAGWQEPIYAYIVCLRILQTAGNPAAEKLIAQGRYLLDFLTQKISDDALRQIFLTAVPAHRELRKQLDARAMQNGYKITK